MWQRAAAMVQAARSICPFEPGSEYQGGPGAGHAVRHFNCGQEYDGQWKDDEHDGEGSLKTPSGATYTGQW